MAGTVKAFSFSYQNYHQCLWNKITSSNTKRNSKLPSRVRRMWLQGITQFPGPLLSVHNPAAWISTRFDIYKPGLLSLVFSFFTLYKFMKNLQRDHWSFHCSVVPTPSPVVLFVRVRPENSWHCSILGIMLIACSSPCNYHHLIRLQTSPSDPACNSLFRVTNPRTMSQSHCLAPSLPAVAQSCSVAERWADYLTMWLPVPVV